MSKTTPIVALIGLCIFAHPMLAGDSPKIIDLQGGYLFDYDDVTDPDDQYPLLIFIASSTEQVILTNGSMIDPRFMSVVDPQLIIQVEVGGDLIFGDNFPQDPDNFLDHYNSVLFDVSGSLKIQNQEELIMFSRGGPGGDEYFFIRSTGSLILDGPAPATIPGGWCDGQLIISENTQVFLTSESEFEFTETGTLTLEKNSHFDAILEDGQVFMGENTSIESEAVLVDSIQFRSGSRIDRYGWLCSCPVSSLIAIDKTDDEFLPPSLNFYSVSFPPIGDSTIELIQAYTPEIGVIDKILTVTGVDEWKSETAQTVSLTSPTPSSESEIRLRWGVDGVYQLAVPLDWCEADLDFDGDLDFFDISVFINSYNAESPLANLQNDLVFDFFDVSAFLNTYTNGCN